MTLKDSETGTTESAITLCNKGLEYYHQWNIEQAIVAFEAAILLDNQAPDYFLYLAQSYVRLGDYDKMRQALGRFIHLENNPDLTDKLEMLFGNMMDAVEETLTQTMIDQSVPLEIIGAAIQMWLEFRVAIGRKSTALGKKSCRSWASALDYAIRKINFLDLPLSQIAAYYKVPNDMTRKAYGLLVEALDIMPCDYRYFRGDENPLDKLVEAAMMLEELEARFYET